MEEGHKRKDRTRTGCTYLESDLMIMCKFIDQLEGAGMNSLVADRIKEQPKILHCESASFLGVDGPEEDIGTAARRKIRLPASILPLSQMIFGRRRIRFRREPSHPWTRQQRRKLQAWQGGTPLGHRLHVRSQLTSQQ